MVPLPGSNIRCYAIRALCITASLGKAYSVVLKVCPIDLWWFLKIFVSIHEVKTMNHETLKQYLHYLPFLLYWHVH